VCAAGFAPESDPTSGVWLKCVANGINCRSIANAVVSPMGTSCMCVGSYTPSYATIGALQSCSKAVSGAVPAADNATAVSGTWTVIPVLANDVGAARRIVAASKPLRGGMVVILSNSSAVDVVRYISREGFVGQDTFNYTTADGTANVTVEVTPRSCGSSRCGVLGSCQAGSCSCAPGSGMLPVFVANPNATARVVTPRSPACRYPGEQL
jgi:hypothetical protein